MLLQRLILLLLSLLTCGAAFAASEADLQIRSVKPGATVKVDKILSEDEVLLSVFDAGKEPLFGLGTADFTVTQSGRTARIKSVKPISESQDIPRHFVLVLDNSSSMKQREAVRALLDGVNELLKIVRPIDDVQMVVFDDDKTVTIGDRDLHVRTFRSNSPAELQAYLAKTYRDGMTNKTVLYEGMLAGLELIRNTPVNNPRFMVVFSDGEDINSAFKKEEVLRVAEGVERFNAFTIDYMPGPDKNRLLADFAANNNGQAWKAASETNLVPIFQSVASKMNYYYVVKYLFPTKGSLAAAPAELTLDEIRAKKPGVDAGAETAFIARINNSELTLRPQIDSAYSIARWKVYVSNSRGVLVEQAGEGSPPPEVSVPLPAADLQALASGGELAVKMEVVDSKEQRLLLQAEPIRVKVAQTKADLAVFPAVLMIDEISTPATSPLIRLELSELLLRPKVPAAYGAIQWRALVSNAGGTVADKAGEGAPPEELKVTLPTADLPALAAGGDLAVQMELQNGRGQKLVLPASPVKVNVLQTKAALAVAPESLTIEEIKTIDASPMLGQIYFEKGSSEIPPRYIRFQSAAETAGFDEQSFRDTLEKYFQVLNIIGKRLAAAPAATIRLVGCNDNTGVEKGKKKLSEQRAVAVKNYLESVWGIAPERISIEARNLPQTPSTSRSGEGQAENRRVELLSADPAILAPIRSTYLATRIDKPALTLTPDLVSPHGIDSWQITAANAAGKLAEMSGKGMPAKEISIPLLAGGDLRAMANSGDIAVRMELQDRKGQSMVLIPAPVKVNFIETSKRLAQKLDQLVQEKYALILFDFDKDTIGGANQAIIDTIVARTKSLPYARVDIVGHTDNIGKESYNIKLSERRALAVYKMLTATYGEGAGDRIRYAGVGPNNPLYENVSPETRSFNRTVTITLEYLSAE